jgi:phosphate/sulfate permease
VEDQVGATIFQLFVISAITMGLSHTLTRERVFAPLRDRLGGKETFLGYLFSCPYCASHWIAFALIPLTGAAFVPVAPSWGIVSDVIQWFLSSILVTVVAAFLRVLFYFVDESQSLVRHERKIADTAIAEETREPRRG